MFRYSQAPWRGRLWNAAWRMERIRWSLGLLMSALSEPENSPQEVTDRIRHTPRFPEVSFLSRLLLNKLLPKAAGTGILEFWS